MFFEEKVLILNQLYNEKVRPYLTSDDKLCISNYTLYSKNYSNYLINGVVDDKDDENDYLHMIESLRKLIKISVLDFPLTVYHGTSINLIGNMNIEDYLKKTNIINPKTFLSTSIDDGVADDCKKDMILEIDISEGDCGLWVDPLSSFRYEFEIILMDNSLFKIDDYYKPKGRELTYVKTTKIG